MSFTKPLNLIYGTMNAANDVQVEGLVLSLETAGTLIPCPAGGTPYGVAYMTTEDPQYNPNSINHSTQYLLGAEMAVVREGLVRVPYHTAGGETISIGQIMSMLGANTAGYVRVHVPTALPGAYNAATLAARLEEQNCIVGIALEAKAANGQTGVSGATHLKVLLELKRTDFTS